MEVQRPDLIISTEKTKQKIVEARGDVLFIDVISVLNNSLRNRSTQVKGEKNKQTQTNEISKSKTN